MSNIHACVWEEIHGFKSIGEFNRFVEYLEKQVKQGFVTEVQVDENYGHGEVYGGRWFKDKETSEVWRLIPPDIPFKGLWEPVKTSQE